MKRETKPITLRPHDVAVALQLALEPEPRYAALARAVGIRLGEAHNSVGRLRQARLLVPGARRAMVPSLPEFVRHGVPYAFPAEAGGESMGVPPALSAPPLAERFTSGDRYVWPSLDGTERGQSVVPLYPAAPALRDANPRLYRLLALVDALRLGRARERTEAGTLLERALRSGEV
jgi:hypothetical protein